MKSQQTTPSAKTPESERTKAVTGQMASTPCPWHVDDNGDILDNQSLLVARPQHRNRKDAELICRAVNAHEPLKNALAGLLDAWGRLAESGDAGYWNHEKDDVVIAARTALTLAGGA